MAMAFINVVVAAVAITSILGTVCHHTVLLDS